MYDNMNSYVTSFYSIINYTVSILEIQRALQRR